MDQETAAIEVAQEAPRRRISPKEMEALMASGLPFPSVPGLLTDDEEEATRRQQLLDQFFEQAIANHQDAIRRHAIGLLGHETPAGE